MNIFCISDIHGSIFEFEDALLKVDLDFANDNKLVLLGDYIHGPSSYEVLDRIIALQQKFGSDRVVALLGNHEEMALNGYWAINQDRFGVYNDDYNEEREEVYLRWFSNLPLYYEIGNAIFVHAGIDEQAASEGFWEIGTSEYIFTSKFPAEIGKIPNFDYKIIAGHIGTRTIANNPRYNDIFYDGFNHYFLDSTVQESGELFVLMYNVEQNEFYKVGDNGATIILPYSEENY